MELVSNISAQISLSATPDAGGVRSPSRTGATGRLATRKYGRPFASLSSPFVRSGRLGDQRAGNTPLSPSVGGGPCRQRKERRYPY